jgi:hypothetical protein
MEIFSLKKIIGGDSRLHLDRMWNLIHRAGLIRKMEGDLSHVLDRPLLFGFELRIRDALRVRDIEVRR